MTVLISLLLFPITLSTILLADSTPGMVTVDFSNPTSFRAERMVTYPSPHPPSQSAEAVDSVDELEFFSGGSQIPDDVRINDDWYRRVNGRWYVRKNNVFVHVDENTTVVATPSKPIKPLGSYPSSHQYRGTLAKLPNETIDGELCKVYRIDDTRTNQQETLWVGVHDGFVHKMVSIFTESSDGKIVPATQATRFYDFNKRVQIARPTSAIDANHCMLYMLNFAMVKQVQPDYPQSEIGLKLGTVNVSLHLLIREDGSVGDASVTKSSGVKAIDDSALTAARQTIFKAPTYLCPGIPRETDATYSFNP